MGTRRHRLPALLAVAVLAAACGFTEPNEAEATAPEPLIPMEREPTTFFVTNEFTVGETYTVGHVGVPEGVLRPLRLVEIDVLASSNIEVVGRGVMPESEIAVGLAPGWPPDGFVEPMDAGEGEWDGVVSPVLGIRTLAPRSGFRGVMVTWIDADGRRGSEIFDFAVVTCAPDACDADPLEDQWLLRELGLWWP